MQHPGRQRSRGREVGRGDAEDVGVADRLGAQAGAHRVADHAAEAGVGAAVGVDRRGVVVRLDLEADVVLVVEPDDARVVGEDADQPVEAEVWVVALKIVCLSRLSMISPSNSIRPRSVLCEQCSLQVWARVSSSQSVGSRPSAAKCAWIVRISARLR